METQLSTNAEQAGPGKVRHIYTRIYTYVSIDNCDMGQCTIIYRCLSWFITGVYTQ